MPHGIWDLSSPTRKIEPMSPSLEGWSLNDWSTKEVLKRPYFFYGQEQAEKSVANTHCFFWKRKDNSERVADNHSQSAGPGPNQ